MNHMLCMHCLEEGNWTDDDKCPRCEKKGHTSPWQVGSCGKCNEEFIARMAEITGRMELRRNYNAVIANLQARVTELERIVGVLDARLIATGTERIGG